MVRNKECSLTRYYLKAYIGLRRWCEHLNQQQRKRVVYGLSFIYLLCALVMMVQFFFPQEEEQPFPTDNGSRASFAKP